MLSPTKPRNGRMLMVTALATIRLASLRMLARPSEIPQALTELAAQTPTATAIPTLMVHGRSPMVLMPVSRVRVTQQQTVLVVLMRTVTAIRTLQETGRSKTELTLTPMTLCAG